MIRHSLKQVGKQTGQREKEDEGTEAELWAFPIWWACFKARVVFIQTSDSTDQASFRSQVVAPFGKKERCRISVTKPHVNLHYVSD